MNQLNSWSNEIEKYSSNLTILEHKPIRYERGGAVNDYLAFGFMAVVITSPVWLPYMLRFFIDLGYLMGH